MIILQYCLNQDIYFFISGPTYLYQFVCYTILVGGHYFPPKSNDSCLPWLLSPSFFYGGGGLTFTAVGWSFGALWVR